MILRSVLCSVVVLLAACGGGEPAKATATPSPAVAAAVLKDKPASPLGVKAATAAGAADTVAVTGRIANVVPGYAVFTLMDLELPYCGEKNPEDHCKTPWDYCCETPQTRAANSMLVELRGADGKPLATPVLPDMRLLDVVSVTGKLTKDEHGTFVLVATGVHRDARPEVPADLKWPQ